MADQANPQFGGQGIPFPGQGSGAPLLPVQPIPLPGMPVAPAQIPVQPVVPPVPVTPVAPTPASFSVPSPVPSPVASPVPMPVAPFPAAATPVAAPSAGAQPAEPKKPMTLEDLAKQTPIFSDDELEEDDFDPWAPLDDSKKTADMVEDDEEAKPSVSPPPVAPKPSPVPPSPEPRPSKPSKPEVTKVEKEDEPEIIEGALLDEDDIDPFEGIEEEGESPLKQFLANANINGKKIAGCVVGFFLILALIVGLFYGGKALFGFLTKESPKSEEVVEKVDEKIEPAKEKEEVVIADLPAGWIEPSIYTGIKVGMEATEGESSAAPEIPGTDISPSNENIVAYVNVLSRIRVLYETDIQAMLNRSTDRNRALNDFISSMKSVSSDARKSITEIAQRKLTLQSEFDSVTAAKQLQEEQYFANLSANNPSETSQNLANFTELARQSVDIRARYRALHKIEEYMNRYAAAVETRIRDTELNREALIKGVKVIDVEGSDIDLIIPESDL